MKRQIKFRGYNLKNNKWLFGYYLVNRGKHYIVQDETVNPFSEPEDFEVDPESVGQYVATIKGIDLYEGDYVDHVERMVYNETICGTYTIKGIHLKYDEETHAILLFQTDKGFPEAKTFVNKKTDFDSYTIEYVVTGNEYEERLKKSNP
jgi:hypothetical protein